MKLDNRAISTPAQRIRSLFSLSKCRFSHTPRRNETPKDIAPAQSSERAVSAESSIIDSQVAGMNSPLQSWVLYRRRVNGTPYPPLQHTASIAVRDALDGQKPGKNDLFHFSCLRNIHSLSPFLSLTPYEVPGGAHVDMHGRPFPFLMQSMLDHHGLLNRIFDHNQCVALGSNTTHVWLQWEDIKLLQPESRSRFLNIEPFKLPDDFEIPLA